MNTQPIQSATPVAGRQPVSHGPAFGRDLAKAAGTGLTPGTHSPPGGSRAAAQAEAVPLKAQDVPLRLRLAQKLLEQDAPTPRQLRAVEYLLVSALTVRDSRTGMRKLLPEDRADALLTWLLEPLPVLSPGLELKEYLTLIEEALTLSTEEAFIEGRLLERARALKYRLGPRFATRGALKASVQCLVLLERVWCDPGFRRTLPPGEAARATHAPLTLLRLPLERRAEAAETESGATRAVAAVGAARAGGTGKSGPASPSSAAGAGVHSTEASAAPHQVQSRDLPPRPPPPVKAPSGEVIVLPAPAPSAIRAPWLESSGGRDTSPVLPVQPTRTVIPGTRAELLGGLGRVDAVQGAGSGGAGYSGGFELIEVHGQPPALDPAWLGEKDAGSMARAEETVAPPALPGPVPGRSAQVGPGPVGRVARALSDAVMGFKRALSSEKHRPLPTPSPVPSHAKPPSESTGVEAYALMRVSAGEHEAPLGTHVRPVPVAAPWAPGSSVRTQTPSPSLHPGSARSSELPLEISERLPAAALQLANEVARAHKGSVAKLFPNAVFPANLRDEEGFIADPNPAFREEPPPLPATAPWELPGVDQDALMREIWALALPGVDPEQAFRAPSGDAGLGLWDRPRSGVSSTLGGNAGASGGKGLRPADLLLSSPSLDTGGISTRESVARGVSGPELPPELAALLGPAATPLRSDGAASVAVGGAFPPEEGIESPLSAARRPARARSQVEFAGIDERDELEALGLDLFRPPPQQRGESPVAGHEDARSVSVRRARRDLPRSDGSGSDASPARVELRPLRMVAVKPEAFRASAQELLPQDSPSHEKIMPTLRTWKTSSPLKALATGAPGPDPLAGQSAFSSGSSGSGSALRRLGARVRESMARGGRGERELSHSSVSDPTGSLRAPAEESGKPPSSPSIASRASAQRTQAGADPHGSSVPVPPWEQSSNGLVEWLIRFQPGRPIRVAAVVQWGLAAGLVLHLVSEPAIPFQESPEAFQSYRIDALAGGVPVASARRLAGVLILTAAPEWTRLKPHQNQRLLAHLGKYLLGQDGIDSIVVVDSGGRLLAQLPALADTAGSSGR